MNRQSTELLSSLGRSLSWPGIAAGVFLALALDALLLLLGAALALSTGDEELGTGFAIWMVISQVVSFTVGGVVAGYLSGATRNVDGALVGILTWAVALVLTRAFLAEGTLGFRGPGSAAWAAFFGALLSVVVTMIGGIWGARALRTAPSPRRPEIWTTTPPATPTSPPV
ncbi:MAG: hypothetical protein HY698_02020 [Deltaproteobacteria bacterium]|nr:hypothetical protein [Deltaproteobacteria bacterium]